MLLEQAIADFRSGHGQLALASPATVLRDVFPEGSEFDGWHWQKTDGVRTLVLRMKR
ncbi:hypothetical protein [Deinococcus ruber]|nr:hypothetical protein [Deinococcus ruber]